MRRDQVLLGFDGWEDTYDYWVGLDDGDFQPPGLMNGLNIQSALLLGDVGYVHL